MDDQLHYFAQIDNYSKDEQLTQHQQSSIMNNNNNGDRTHTAEEISMDFKKLDLANKINQINNLSQADVDPP